MIKYKVNIDYNDIDLNLMGRIRNFKKNEEVCEDAYTKAYPQYFKRIGTITGLNSFLASHIFVKDEVKNTIKSKTKPKIKSTEKELVEKIEDLIDKEENSEEKIEDIEKLINDVEDVKIETEE